MKSPVLLVEDDAEMRDDLAFLLQHRGFNVVTAANGREALDRMRAEGPPALLLLDLMMPVMDGWTLCAELKKDPALKDVPVVLLSGAGDLRAEAALLDVAAYLKKPIDLEKLYSIVARHC